MLSPGCGSKIELCRLGEGEADLTRQRKRAFSLHDVGNSLCIHIPAGRKEQTGEHVFNVVKLKDEHGSSPIVFLPFLQLLLSTVPPQKVGVFKDSQGLSKVKVWKA